MTKNLKDTKICTSVNCNDKGKEICTIMGFNTMGTSTI